MQLDKILSNMSCFDIVLGMIRLRRGRFKEEALYHGIREASLEHGRLRDIVRRSGDSTSFYDTMFFMLGAQVVQQTGDWQHTYMTSSGITFADKQLREQYGDDVFDILCPLAARVWEAAEKYHV